MQIGCHWIRFLINYTNVPLLAPTLKDSTPGRTYDIGEFARLFTPCRKGPLQENSKYLHTWPQNSFMPFNFFTVCKTLLWQLLIALLLTAFCNICKFRQKNILLLLNAIFIYQSITSFVVKNVSFSKTSGPCFLGLAKYILLSWGLSHTSLDLLHFSHFPGSIEYFKWSFTFPHFLG